MFILMLGTQRPTALPELEFLYFDAPPLADPCYRHPSLGGATDSEGALSAKGRTNHGLRL